jgi:hypothetical protein
MGEPKKPKTKAKTTHPPSGRAIPVRFKDEVLNQIEIAADLSDLSQAAVIRLATKIGLRYMKKINYELDEAIFEKLDGTVEL